MRAIAYRRNVETGESGKLENIKQPLPKPEGYDVLIEVKAVSVNPVDFKVWKKLVPVGDEYKILGYDASGVVVAVGEKVTMFKPEDEVWCAGDITRQGCFEKFHLADQRLIAHKPASLSFAQAAALPLTSLTAWELLFDRMCIPQGNDSTAKTVLVIGAAGGVGSVMIQLLKSKTACNVVATAGSKASRQWLVELGADHVIDYKQPLTEGFKKLHIPNADYVVSLTHTDQYVEEIARVIAPEGRFGLIDDPEQLDIRLFKQKSVQVNWEYMFTRSMFKLPDMIKQHNILHEVAKLVDEGKLKTTMTERLYPICAENIHRAFEQIKQHSVRGKIVLEGW